MRNSPKGWKAFAYGVAVIVTAAVLAEKAKAFFNTNNDRPGVR